MIILKGEQTIHQMEKRKGGYFYLHIAGEVVKGLENKGKTRLICLLNNKFSLRCGLNSFGDGNYFIILSKSNLKRLASL
jgi:hypothetical protein